jgi:PEP-CTERM motif
MSLTHWLSDRIGRSSRILGVPPRPSSSGNPNHRCRGLLTCLLAAAAFTPRPAQAGPVLFIANGQSNIIGKYDATTGATISSAFVTTSAFGVHHLALDGNNHLFVSDSYQNTVSEYNATTGAIINANFISGLNEPMGLALDGNNHLFVGNVGVPGGTVGEYNAATGATINANFIDVNQGLDSAYALALDAPNNHLFVADAANNNIAEFDATTGATTSYGFSHHDTFGLAFDGLNHLFITGSEVEELDATTGATINGNFITGFVDSVALTLDGNNHMFVTDAGTNTVGEYNATTGAAIYATFINGQGLNEPGDIVFSSSVPEPSTFMLAGMGVLRLLTRRQGRRRSTSSLNGQKGSPVLRPTLEALEERLLFSTLTVLNNFDGGAGSLRAEIAAAHNGDTIRFATSMVGKTITLTSGELLIKQNVTIAGPVDRNVTVSGNNASRVFDVGKTTRNVTLSGLTISNGSANGPTNTTIQGGGIYNAGTLTVSNSNLSYNTANNNGGGIANDGTLTLSGCTLSNNSVPQGAIGGIGGGIANFGTLTISGCSLSNNFADGGYGGGFYNDGAATISGSTLFGNSAWGGGGIYDGAGTLTVSGSTLSGNVAAYSGGGIYITGGPYGTVTVKNSSTITGNIAPIGFGADVFDSGVLYQDSTSMIGILDGNAAVLI